MAPNDKEVDTIEEAIESFRTLLKVNRSSKVEIPISLVRDSNPDEMIMRQGEWVEFDHWPGMRCMLTREDEGTKSKYILCHVLHEMDLGAHKHDGFVEEIHMMEGMMYDKIHCQNVTTGQRIKYPAGESHWPIFYGESFFMVIFRKLSRD